MFPSSPVSVGMFPSNRTLEVGAVQVDVPSPLTVTFEQCAVAEDPFTDSVSAVGNENCAGISIQAKQYNRMSDVMMCITCIITSIVSGWTSKGPLKL